METKIRMSSLEWDRLNASGAFEAEGFHIHYESGYVTLTPSTAPPLARFTDMAKRIFWLAQSGDDFPALWADLSPGRQDRWRRLARCIARDGKNVLREDYRPDDDAPDSPPEVRQLGHAYTVLRDALERGRTYSREQVEAAVEHGAREMARAQMYARASDAVCFASPKKIAHDYLRTLDGGRDGS